MEERIKALAIELERISRELTIISEVIPCSKLFTRETGGCDYDFFISGSTYAVVDSPSGFEISVKGDAP